MSEKCKVGFWKWLLIKSPIMLLKSAIADIMGHPYHYMMTGGMLGVIAGFLVATVFSTFLVGVTVVVLGLLISAFGYYKGVVC